MMSPAGSPPDASVQESDAPTTPSAVNAGVSSIRAVERVCDIFDLLRDASDGMSLTEIAQRTKLPKSTIYRYLVALSARGYVDRDVRTNMVRPGLTFRPKRAQSIERFLRFAESELVAFRDEAGETVNIGLLDGGQYVHAVVVESRQIVRLAARVGERASIHCTAIGKVIAGQLPVERVRTILLAEGMPRLTHRTITAVDDYLREVERARQRGYALDDRESQEDGRCVAVALTGLELPAGLSLSAPASRLPLSRVPDVVSQLQQWEKMLISQYGGEVPAQ